jgi:hypothetical protein
MEKCLLSKVIPDSRALAVTWLGPLQVVVDEDHLPPGLPDHLLVGAQLAEAARVYHYEGVGVLQYDLLVDHNAEARSQRPGEVAHVVRQEHLHLGLGPQSRHELPHALGGPYDVRVSVVVAQYHNAAADAVHEPTVALIQLHPPART